jgi:hypothetical protein
MAALANGVLLSILMKESHFPGRSWISKRLFPIKTLGEEDSLSRSDLLLSPRRNSLA